MLKNKIGFLCGLMGALALWGCAEADGGGSVDTTDSPSSCGNGVCDDGETASNCAGDCSSTVTPPAGNCGNGTCDNGETEATCPNDCHTGTPEPVDHCGNGICEPDENHTACPQDCEESCGNSTCETDKGESNVTCPEDCPKCGNGSCERLEDKKSCPSDCGYETYCGNGTCDPGETRIKCPEDCPAQCGDNLCEEGEEECEEDCGTPNVEYQAVCGDGVCDEDEKCDEDCKPDDVVPAMTMDEFNSLKEGNFRFMYDFDKTLIAMTKPTSEMTDEEFAEQLSNFFSFPYPSELRTDDTGHVKFDTYPMPPIVLLDNPLVGGLIGLLLPSIKGLVDSLVVRLQRERKGFSPIGATYFRASVRFDPKEFPKPAETTSPDSCFQLINVESDSKYYGERVPLYVSFHRSANKVWADNTLVMRPVPGMGARPGEHYVAIVGNCLTSNGRSLNQSNKLRQILNGSAPKEINDKLGPYVDEIKRLADDGKLGMKISDIRAMTGYYTLNAADEMDQMAKDLEGKGYVVAENGVAVGEYETRTTYNWNVSSLNGYVFKGSFVTANYINGQYPYSASTGDDKLPVGEMTFDKDGKLLSKRQEEAVEFRIVIPRTPMPEKGYPIAVYGHGTGGGSDSHCDWGGAEGFTLINGGWTGTYAKPTAKAVPMAMIGFDASLHGARAGGKEMNEVEMYMMMFNEPIVIRESWRQTVLDMLVLYDIIERGELVLPPLPGDPEKKNVIFDPSYGLYMGHSQGSQEGGLLLGLTGKIKNAFLSAGGAGILLSFVDLKPDLSSVDEKIRSFLGDRTVADILGMLFGLQDGDISYDTFLTNHFIQPLVDPIDPLNYTQRFIKDPPAGWPSKNIVQTIGIGDRNTPNSAQFAMVAAEGLPAIGEVFNYSDPMELQKLHQSSGKSASGNVQGGANKVTAGALQFKNKGDGNPHFVIYHIDSATNSYIDFFGSVLAGKPKVSVSGKQEDSY